MLQAAFGLQVIVCHSSYKPFTFYIIIDMVGLKSAILIFVLYLTHLFFDPCSLFLGLLLN